MNFKKHTFKFAGKASHPKNSLALIYDLEGFSQFFNQPDVQDYVPIFLNHVSRAVEICLFDGEQYWLKHRKHKLEDISIRVVHEKFMGDGALYIIEPPVGSSDFDSKKLHFLCNRLWNLKNNFDEVIKKILDKVPVVGIPHKIRFGLSRGSVYELKKPNTTSREYIGFCINLASRLQNYCPGLGFMASARLMIPSKDLESHGYQKIVATKIKGFPNEIVIVDTNEYDQLSDEIRNEFFKEPQ